MILQPDPPGWQPDPLGVDTPSFQCLCPREVEPNFRNIMEGRFF